MFMDGQTYTLSLTTILNDVRISPFVMDFISNFTLNWEWQKDCLVTCSMKPVLGKSNVTSKIFLFPSDNSRASSSTIYFRFMLVELSIFDHMTTRKARRNGPYFSSTICPRKVLICLINNKYIIFSAACDLNNLTKKIHNSKATFSNNKCTVTYRPWITSTLHEIAEKDLPS